MTWFFVTLACALSLAFADTFTKKYLTDFTGISLLLPRLAYPGLILLPFSLYIGMPDAPAVFWYYMLLLVPLEILAMWLYVLAIRDAPLHLTLPYLSFTPVLNIITGYLILDESITWGGITGIALIVIGAYILNQDAIKSSSRDFFAPITAIIKLRGSRRMLTVAIIYSFTSVLGKEAMQYTSPYTFGAFYCSLVGFCVLIGIILFRPIEFKKILQRSKAAMLVGVFMAMMVVTHFIAISMVEVAYMMAVKRTSLLFGILLGAWMFRDMNFRQHLPAVIIMLSGIFFILL